jgi:hypothetical protein
VALLSFNRRHKLGSKELEYKILVEVHVGLISIGILLYILLNLFEIKK